MIFAYEPDYILMMRFVLENIGECPQTVVSPDLPDPYWDEGIWLVLNLTIEKAFIKTYVGKRFVNEFGAPTNNAPVDEEDYLHKNELSSALLSLEQLELKFNMKKGGAKLCLLNIKVFDVFDYRLNTKLCNDYRKVLGSCVKEKLRVEEEGTTIVDFDKFVAETLDDFDVDLEENDTQPSEDEENDVDGQKRKKKS